jgi:molybdenum cofactor cytidylyltransferase
MMKIKCGGLILAAGTSSRWRAHMAPHAQDSKMLALYQGEPILRHVVRAALGAQLAPLCVVTGFEAQKVEAALACLNVHCIFNPAYQQGMASSLQAGMAGMADIDALCVLLGDMPLISSALITELCDAFAHQSCDGLVPFYQGQRGNPVILGRAIIDRISSLRGDQGARALLKSHGHIIEYSVHDAAVIRDVDEPSALNDLQ